MSSPGRESKARRDSCALVWFRNDLRLEDHPALAAAAQSGSLVIPVSIWSPEEEGPWAPGAASRYWLHQSLTSLARSLRSAGSRLILRQGPAWEVLADLAQEANAVAVYYGRRYEPSAIQQEERVDQALETKGVKTQGLSGSLLFEPREIRNKQGKPFQVFTPFWRHCLSLPEPAQPLPPPRRIPSPKRWPDTEALEAFDLLPKIPWAEGIRRFWQPGEAGARQRLTTFLEQAIADYGVGRDRPDREGVSFLSPHLHFGEISPRQLWHEVRRWEGRSGKKREAGEGFLRQLGWREFAHHLLYHFPHTPERPLRSEFEAFPWERDSRRLKAWQQGETGYPFVDAGLRQLWSTGWMHNRVRMVVASFLVKDLRIDWQRGAEWFWDTLVDADLANNTLGWQWTAGCGADAAPYFRIFNPVGQGEKFDPEGEYVRRWVPELAGLPARWIHRPWEAPPDVLEKSGVRLGEDYPEPIVSHSQARIEALAALKKMKHPGAKQ